MISDKIKNNSMFYDDKPFTKEDFDKVVKHFSKDNFSKCDAEIKFLCPLCKSELSKVMKEGYSCQKCGQREFLVVPHYKQEDKIINIYLNEED